MFGRDAYMPSVQLEHPQIQYMDTNNSLLALDALRDSYVLAIHNIILSREREENQFLIYCIPKFHVGDKVSVQNHIRDMWDPKYYAAYCVVSVMKQQLALVDKSDKIYEVNSQKIEATYPVDELIKCLPYSKEFIHVTEY